LPLVVVVMWVTISFIWASFGLHVVVFSFIWFVGWGSLKCSYWSGSSVRLHSPSMSSWALWDPYTITYRARQSSKKLLPS
jgi:hypothetical protein